MNAEAKTAVDVALPRWIHMRAMQEPIEVWLSFEQSVWSKRGSHFCRCDNYTTGERIEYDFSASRFDRRTLGARDAEKFRATELFFHSLFQGKERLEGEFADDRIVRQERRQTQHEGVDRLDYHVWLSRAQDLVWPAVFHLDPIGLRPEWFALYEGDREVLRFDFSYPAEGPADIYALGAPHAD